MLFRVMVLFLLAGPAHAGLFSALGKAAKLAGKAGKGVGSAAKVAGKSGAAVGKMGAVGKTAVAAGKLGLGLGLLEVGERAALTFGRLADDGAHAAAYVARAPEGQLWVVGREAAPLATAPEGLAGATAKLAADAEMVLVVDVGVAAERGAVTEVAAAQRYVTDLEGLPHPLRQGPDGRWWVERAGDASDVVDLAQFTLDELGTDPEADLPSPLILLGEPSPCWNQTTERLLVRPGGAEALPVLNAAHPPPGFPVVVARSQAALAPAAAAARAQGLDLLGLVVPDLCDGAAILALQAMVSADLDRGARAPLAGAAPFVAHEATGQDPLEVHATWETGPAGALGALWLLHPAEAAVLEAEVDEAQEEPPLWFMVTVGLVVGGLAWREYRKKLVKTSGPPRS